MGSYCIEQETFVRQRKPRVGCRLTVYRNVRTRRFYDPTEGRTLRARGIQLPSSVLEDRNFPEWRRVSDASGDFSGTHGLLACATFTVVRA